MDVAPGFSQDGQVEADEGRGREWRTADVTATEWAGCASPADMLEALAALRYPAEVIRQAAVRVLKLGPEFADEPFDWWHTPATEGDAVRYDAERERRYAKLMLLKPDCLDPAVQFRVAYTLGEHTPDADLIRELVGNPLAPPFTKPEWLSDGSSLV